MKKGLFIKAFFIACLLGVSAVAYIQRAASHEKMLLQPKSEICWMCHGDKKDVFNETGHGAVGLTCDVCHDPHGTGQTGMTLEPVNDLCFTCHGDMEDHFDKSEHGDAELTCVMCHDPHGTPDGNKK